MKYNYISKISFFLSKFLLPIIIIIIIEVTKRISCFCEFYNQYIYPYLSKLLYSISAVLPFSIYDVSLILIIVFILFQLYKIIFIAGKRLKGVIIIIQTLMWCYIFFYLCWGINYFSLGITKRNELNKTFTEQDFDNFIIDYINNLNNNLPEQLSYDKKTINENISEMIALKAPELGIPTQIRKFETKDILFSGIYAKMGIRGYYGPFFAEAHISSKSLPFEIPALISHEISHLLGITSEAEANFLAYVLTTESNLKEIRFSGYFSILPYVLRDAKTHYNKDEYNEFISKIDPQIITLLQQKYSHWNELYSDRIGDIQNFIYEFYLKNNNIPSGRKNYGEVINIIVNYYYK